MASKRNPNETKKERKLFFFIVIIFLKGLPLPGQVSIADVMRSLPALYLMTGLYALMALLGGVLYWWRIAGDDWSSFQLPTAAIGFGMVFSLLLVLVVVGGNLVGLRYSRGLRRAQHDLVEVFEPVGIGGIILLGLVSSVGEEIFFRAYLQREVGLILSSLLFGVLHWPPKRAWWPWPFFAFAMGLLLGYLHTLTESLLYPVLVHWAINSLNLTIAFQVVGAERKKRARPVDVDSPSGQGS